MWQVRERLCEHGGSHRVCEDGVVARIEGGRALFVVLDGVSSIAGSIEGYMVEEELVPGGHWAMWQVQRFFERVDLSTIWDAFDVVCRTDEALELAFRIRGTSRDERWRLPAVAAIVVVTDEAENTFTWAQVADCMLMHERPDGARFVLENPMAEIDAATLRLFRDCNGNRDDERVRAALRAQYQGRNKPGSYPVLDGDVNRDLVRSNRLPLSSVQRFALWSDGLQTLSDDKHAVGSAVLTDLGAWHRKVVAREEADPTFLNPLRLKNDDKSALVIERA